MSVSSRWITFDCYGTLADWQTWFAAVLEPIAGSAGREMAAAYQVHERRVERGQPHRPYKDVFVTALTRAAADLGIRLPPDEAQELVRAWGSMPLFADVETMLAELRSRGYRLAVLTNCDDDLFELTHRQFRVPFDLFVTAERVRGYKPERWHFRGFELLTRVARENWAHVANSWYHDIAPARAFGVKRVWLDRDRSGDDPRSASIHVHSASEVAGAIDRLFAGGAAMAGVHGPRLEASAPVAIG